MLEKILKLTTKSNFKEGKIDRRNLIKSSVIFSVLTLIDQTIFERETEASELIENVNWEKGIELLIKDVFVSPVETSGAFVELENGEWLWVNIRDKSTTQGFIDPKVIIAEIISKGIDLSQIQRIISMHSHPLSAYLSLDKESERIIKIIKETKKTDWVILPPSPADLDLHLPGWNKNVHKEKVMEEEGLNSSLFKEWLVELGWTWLRNKITVEKLPKDSELRLYLEAKKDFWIKWKELMNNKLETKIAKYSTEELKRLLLKYATKPIIFAIKKGNLKRRSLVEWFKMALSYSYWLIDEFVSEEDIEIAKGNLEINKKTSEIENRLRKAYKSIYTKNLNGTVYENDINEFINAVYWNQINLTFKPHSEELILDIKKKLGLYT